MLRKKIIVNVHAFSVLQKNFNRRNITCFTKKFGDVVRKVENQALVLRFSRIKIERESSEVYESSRRREQWSWTQRHASIDSAVLRISTYR